MRSVPKCLAAGWIVSSLVGCVHSAQTQKVEPQHAAPQEVANAPWQRSSDIDGWQAKAKTEPVLIHNAAIWIGDGRQIANGYVLLKDGKISQVGAGTLAVEPNTRVIDAGGRVVTPGLIDTHSHMGVYPMPHARAHEDGNEMSAPVTAEVRAIDSFWPQDPAIERAVAGGVTTIQALPGSANLIGGHGVTLKLVKATSSRAMHFNGAKDGLKMACGENPKRVYGGKGAAPGTRMGNLAGQRAAFLAAKDLQRQWVAWRAQEAQRLSEYGAAKSRYDAEKKLRAERRTRCEAYGPRDCAEWAAEWADNPLVEPANIAAPPPARNLPLETLVAAMNGDILVHIHCYRADDIVNMIALADEMGFTVRSFHHGLEAYKIRDELAKRDIAVSTWADWWGFKLEAFDGIPQTLALLEEAGARPVVHSDSAEGIRRLNQEAAKALYSGRHSGVDVDESRAIRWITLNPAWALGIEDRVGTLEAGKDADVVIWSGDPLSVYTSADQVFIDGVERYDRAKRAKTDAQPWSDFEAGR